MADDTSTTPIGRLVTLLSVVLVIVALYVAQDVFVPLAIAMLLSFLLAPVVFRLERWWLGRIPAVLIVAVVCFALIAGVGALVTSQVISLAERLPRYESNIREKIESLQPSGTGTFSRLEESAEQIESEITDEGEGAATQTAPDGAPAEPGGPEPEAPAPVRVRVVDEGLDGVTMLQSVGGALLSPLGKLGIVIITVIFFLVGWEDLRDRVIRLIGSRRIGVTTQALNEAGRRVSQYLLMLSIVNGTYGVAVGVGLAVIGVPSALFWGLLAALIRYIPYIGPWIGAALPIVLSFAVFEGWLYPLLVVGWFVLIELVSNNVIEPWLYGKRTGVSAVAILVGAVFWTWMWGPIGLLLATPLTVCLVVLGRHVPQLEFFSILLSDTPALAPAVRFYQRLLALDWDDAMEVLEAYRRNHSLPALYDELIVPALATAEQDRHRGVLPTEREQYFYRSINDLLEDLAPGEAPPADEAQVLCVSGGDEADALAARALAQLLNEAGVSAAMGDACDDQGASETREAAAPRVVCLSLMPPLSMSHARQVYRQLRRDYPDATLVIGLWTHAYEAGQTEQRLRNECGGNLATTLSAMIEMIRSLPPQAERVR